MIDAHTAATAWWAAVGLVMVGAMFVCGMAYGVKREQERQEWIARRRAREMRR